ncbi:hypothetical protein [Cellvibrio sp. PSBB006]|uniref:hypothetical protein n=1 Tax=Cellvibrio sp. PSBB006 TaxID=1987723 RepID=UPI000B3BA5CD|nr:hypothetical protein [Cellvibrio sp. PSBB006]ARU26624.1 hypothetical protein CBR65_03825 [Cellvibrio sp. PSBB006]
MQAALISLIAAGASSNQIAEAAVNEWREIDAVLSPIIGLHGVAALYKRALHLILDDYPWMISAHDEQLVLGDFASLKMALAKRTSAEASAANLSLFQSFHSTLVSLIGESLTDRLLISIVDNPLRGDAAQDIPS